MEIGDYVHLAFKDANGKEYDFLADKEAMDKIFKDKTNVPARLEYVVERTWIPEGEDMDGRGSCFVTKRPQEPKY